MFHILTHTEFDGRKLTCAVESPNPTLSNDDAVRIAKLQFGKKNISFEELTFDQSPMLYAFFNVAQVNKYYFSEKGDLSSSN